MNREKFMSESRVEDSRQDYAIRFSGLMLILSEPFDHYVDGVVDTWKGKGVLLMLFQFVDHSFVFG